MREGYLYSFKNGEVDVIEGHVEYHKSVFKHYTDKRDGMFYSDDHNPYRCSAKPGVIAYDKLWLEERDDIRAIDLFIAREREKIDELGKKIVTYEEKIDLLDSIKQRGISRK